MTRAEPVRHTDRLTPDEIAAVLSLAAEAEKADGVFPLSEDVVLRVRGGEGSFYLADDVGFATVDDGSGELVVHPAHRRRGDRKSVV